MPRTPPSRLRHGLKQAKTKVSLRGLAAIDKRRAGARANAAFRDELVSALGGEVELSPQQRKLVDLAARASLFLDHIDSWLMGQPELVVDRALIPALVQRREMADHLTRVLVQLGLERRPRKVQGLEEYVAERYTGNGAERRDEAPSPVGEGEAG